MKNQKRRKEENNIFIELFAIGVIIILIFSLIYSYYSFNELKRDYGCYIFHVQECLNCHQQNLTYLLCSGFCVEPSIQDFDGKGCPVVNPLNNCFDLPKECNL